MRTGGGSGAAQGKVAEASGAGMGGRSQGNAHLRVSPMERRLPKRRPCIGWGLGKPPSLYPSLESPAAPGRQGQADEVTGLRGREVQLGMAGDERRGGWIGEGDGVAENGYWFSGPAFFLTPRPFHYITSGPQSSR